MTSKQRKIAQAILNCCCVTGSPGERRPPVTGSPITGSPGDFPPGIPIENCCFCPDQNGDATVPRFLNLDWFDGCIGARTATLEFGGVGFPEPPQCKAQPGNGLIWSFAETFPNPHPLRPGLLFCKEGDFFPSFGTCCQDLFKVECLPGGKCFVIKALRTRQYHGGIGNEFVGMRLHVLSCRPFLAVFNHPAGLTYFDPECNYTFSNGGICPPCQNVPCFGVVSEA